MRHLFQFTPSFVLLLFLLFFTQTIEASPTPVTKLMIQELNPLNFNTDFSQYDQKTAIFCAQLSDAAYISNGDSTKLKNMLSKSYNNSVFLQFVESSATHTRAIIYSCDKFVVVAFRGTEFSSLKDITTDADFVSYQSLPDADSIVRDLPPGHGGFRGGSISLVMDEDIFDKIRDAILKAAGKNDISSIPVYTTGHSMGAGYASLFIRPIAKRFKYGGTYNFSPPLVIDCDSAKALGKDYNGIVYDIVNYKDYVARAGAKCRYYMSHFGKFYRISKSGVIYREDEQYVRWSKAERTPGNLYRYHKLAGYENALRSPQNANENISLRRKNGETVFKLKYVPIECHQPEF